jgi:hypothetical protein
MTDLFEYVNSFPRNTGLPCTIYISVHGVVATDSYSGAISREHAEAVSAWITLNQQVLMAHWNGSLDGVELSRALGRIEP